MDAAISAAIFADGVANAIPFLQLQHARVISQTYPDLVFDLPHRQTQHVCRFRLRLDDFDERPASILVLDSDNQIAPHAAWPQSGLWNPTNGGTLCYPGVREYYQHPSHCNESWDAHRIAGHYTVGHYVEIIINKFFEAQF
ncbi:MAG TPA: hypothetical protein VF157_12235 [Chloroflexota bacterium]